MQEVEAVSSQLSQLLISFKAGADAGAVARVALALPMVARAVAPLPAALWGTQGRSNPVGLGFGMGYPIFHPQKEHISAELAE